MVVKCVIGVARLCDGRLSQRGKEVMVKLSESISRKKVPKFKLFTYNINHRVLKIGIGINAREKFQYFQRNTLQRFFFKFPCENNFSTGNKKCQKWENTIKKVPMKKVVFFLM